MGPRTICLFSFGKCVFPKISVCFQPPKKARWFTNNEPNYVSTNISFCFQPPKKKLAVSPTMSQTTFQQKYLFVSNHQKKARCFTNNEPHYVSTKTTKNKPAASPNTNTFCFQPQKQISLVHQQKKTRYKLLMFELISYLKVT